MFLQSGDTALHEAASCGNNDIVLNLLDRGAKIDSVNKVSVHYIKYSLVSPRVYNKNQECRWCISP